ncbi:hypothetical protein MY11210_008687 [Beauveria gryllotalpidicola]
MSRSVHQANHSDDNYLRRIPAWHHQNSFKFYTPSTSARMEMGFEMERRGEWHWPASREESGPIPPSFYDACLCPCSVYSRSWARLKAAFAGHDAQQDPNLGWFNSDCCSFVTFLPLYGIPISQLQATVRAVYGIKGSLTHDSVDAVCCPCTTLQRSEYEIMIREKHHQQRHPVEIPSYISQGSMAYAPSNASTPSSTQPEKSREEPKDPIPCIKIDAVAVSVLRQPVDGNIPTINITSPQVVIETPSPSQSVLCAADPQVASGHIIQPEHSLEDDPTVVVVRGGKFKEHRLHDDPRSETSSLQREKEHDLQEDVSHEKPKPNPEHTLVECTDGTTSPRSGFVQPSADLFSVKEVPEHTNLSIGASCLVDDDPKTQSATRHSTLAPAIKPGESPDKASV